MVGRFGFRGDDVEDLEQELAMHVFQRTPRFRIERGTRQAFVATVAKHKLLHLVEQRMAAKRGQGRVIQPERWQDEWLRDRRTTPARVRLAIDVRLAVSSLPSDLRQVTALLLQGHRQRDIERLLGLTRQQIRGRMRTLATALAPLSVRPKQNPTRPTIRQTKPVVNG